MKFLEGVAQQLYREYGEQIGHSLLVFPNRRSTLFFKKELANELEKALFLPPIVTFKELIVELSNWREADRVELLFDLYLAYNDVVEGGESFDQFFYWGELILNDFNSVDKELVNSEQLFINVKELKEIESDYSFLSERQKEAVKSFWSGFLPERGSLNKGNFREAWEILLPLYREFNRRLSEKECGYEGALYRRVAESEKLQSTLMGYQKVIFIGFNELSESEKRVMELLKRSDKALFFWDYRSPLVRDEEGSASRYFKENLNNFPSAATFLTDDIDKKKGACLPHAEIEVISTSSTVMQAKIVGELLEKENYGDQSAVILPDESLLIPLLSSIPESVESINITMGYPIANTPIISFIKGVVELELSSKGLYFKRALPLLNHSYVRRVAGEEAIELISTIHKRNYIFIPTSLYSDNPFFSLLFKDPAEGEEPAKELCNKLLSLLDLLLGSGEMEKIEREFIFHVRATVERVKGLLIPISLKSFSKLIMMALRSIAVPFAGEPLTGLQIMGLLESRSLDFKHLIICSLNEGILPKESSKNSFIPYTLREGFGLPVKESDDALSAYLFYRLLHRAERVTLLYNSQSEGIKSGERSRYLLQLKYLYHLIDKESTLSYRVEEEQEPSLLKPIEKSGEMVEQLLKRYTPGGRGGLSASSLNSYLNCPRRFYFSQVEGLEESEEVTEEMEASEFGSIYHLSMERLYAPFKGGIVTKEQLRELSRDRALLLRVVEEGFKEYKQLSKIEGYYLIIRDLIVRYLEITLKYDSRVAPFTIEQLEANIVGMVELSGDKRVATKGFIDRVDRRREGGTIRVIDYKSGVASLTFKRGEGVVEKLFERGRSSRLNPTFQMFFYGSLLNRGLPIEVSIYSLRALARSGESVVELYPEEFELFNNQLKLLVEEILDEKIPFYPTERRDNCKWCPYKALCF